MAVTSSSLKAHLRLPPDFPDNLDGYINAAKAKAAAAGVPEFRNNALYDHFIHELAAHYYENRGLSYSGSYKAAAEATAKNLVNSYVLELRYAEDGPAQEGEET